MNITAMMTHGEKTMLKGWPDAPNGGFHEGFKVPSGVGRIAIIHGIESGAARQIWEGSRDIALHIAQSQDGRFIGLDGVRFSVHSEKDGANAYIIAQTVPEIVEFETVTNGISIN